MKREEVTRKAEPNVLFECSFIGTARDSVSEAEAEFVETGKGHVAARLTDQGLLIVNHWNNAEYKNLYALIFTLPNFPLNLQKYVMEWEWKVGWYRNSSPTTPGSLFPITNYNGDEDGIGNGGLGDSKYYDNKTPDYDLLYSDSVDCMYDWRKFTVETSVSGTSLSRRYTNHGTGATWTSTGTKNSSTDLKLFVNWNSANGFLGYVRNMKIWKTE